MTDRPQRCQGEFRLPGEAITRRCEGHADHEGDCGPRCEAGCHDFHAPVVVRGDQRTLGFKREMEQAVVFCRRCGYRISFGWDVPDGES